MSVDPPVPKTIKAWTIEGLNGFDSLKFHKDAPIPEPSDYEVLVKFHAASLNYRDLAISKGQPCKSLTYSLPRLIYPAPAKRAEQPIANRRVGQYPFPSKDGVVPGSDGAGEVVAIGSKVTRFQPGAKVVTLFNQQLLGGSLDHHTITTTVGSIYDGTLRQYGTYNENGLVDMPPSLTWREAATLSCAGLTAWNALYGLKPLRPGDVVLTQGTGGVSIFALQFAKAAGATVIATTSSPTKASRLKDLGADHVINYKETPDWGEAAAKLTPKGEGVSHVVEIGGPATMAQSLKAVKIDGVITVIGFVGGPPGDEQPGFLGVLQSLCVVRGVLVGSRVQFEEMSRAIEGRGIKPCVDERVFGIEEVREYVPFYFYLYFHFDFYFLLLLLLKLPLSFYL